MKIHQILQDNTLLLSVSGMFSSAKDENDFVAELASCKAEKLEINFPDVRMLPQKVILGLKSAFTSGRFASVKVSVYHRYLSSYLSRLGIRNHCKSCCGYASNDRRIKALAIGGSAGSLDGIFSIVSALPLSGISIFIVQHILEKSPNYLQEILSNRTKYKVMEATDGMVIRPDTAYIAAPGFHLEIHKGKLHLADGDRVNFSKPSISRLFCTAASEYGAALTCILLCGYGSDGSDVLPLLKQKGVNILVQDPEECVAQDMLLSAIKTGCVDYKFPMPELCSYLSRMIMESEPEIGKTELQIFLTAIHDKYGYNYQRYESASLIRRIKHGMKEMNIRHFNRFKELVLSDEDMFEFLFLEFSINVTELFRDPDIYKAMRENLFPYLASFPHIKIWSAGCSTGMEPYSVAITLKESGLLGKTQIYASDINPFVIEEAKNGLLSSEAISKGNPKYAESKGTSILGDYFTAHDGMMQLNDEILKQILFFQHSLLNPGRFHEFQLILCRNVLIYFDKELQKQVLKLFVNSLDLNGFLILGKNESTAVEGLKLIDKANNIYKRVE